MVSNSYVMPDQPTPIDVSIHAMQKRMASFEGSFKLGMCIFRTWPKHNLLDMMTHLLRVFRAAQPMFALEA